MKMENEHTIAAIPVLSSFEQSKELDQLFTALAKFQGSIADKMPEKNKSVEITTSKGTYRYKYADLGDILSKVYPITSGYGLSITQYPVREADGSKSFITILGHTSGQWIRSKFILDPESPGIKGVGAAITYTQRYCFNTALGITSEEDTDGILNEPNESPSNIYKPYSKPLEGPASDKQLNTIKEFRAKYGEEAFLNIVGLLQIDPHNLDKDSASKLITAIFSYKK